MHAIADVASAPSTRRGRGSLMQILRRARDAREGDVWGWGANYDGQLGIADGCRMDRWRPTRQVSHLWS